MVRGHENHRGGFRPCPSPLLESNWRKSSYSGDNGGECVHVASAAAVQVRDTADRNGPVLAFTADAWQAFIATIS
jgi:hypothetical protein